MSRQKELTVKLTENQVKSIIMTLAEANEVLSRADDRERNRQIIKRLYKTGVKFGGEDESS